jgi:hypothetical protein
VSCIETSASHRTCLPPGGAIISQGAPRHLLPHSGNFVACILCPVIGRRSAHCFIHLYVDSTTIESETEPFDTARRLSPADRPRLFSQDARASINLFSRTSTNRFAYICVLDARLWDRINISTIIEAQIADAASTRSPNGTPSVAVQASSPDIYSNSASTFKLSYKPSCSHSIPFNYPPLDIYK